MVHRKTRNGQYSSRGNNAKRQPYILLADDEEEVLLLLKKDLENKDDNGSASDGIAVEQYVATKVRNLLDKLSVSGPLSPREVEVLKHVALGHANKQIGHALGVSEQTVKNHLSHIMSKLGASDRTHAVILALHSGWLDIEDVLDMAAQEEPVLTASDR